ncbi:MAG: Transcriptional repressor IclR [Actinomycetota bacterium]|jgi:DNA-binding IclR family transcriptional regulator
MPDKTQVPAADQTLAILGFLARQRASVPAATIASALDIPRSTTYHLLATLAEHGFVVNGERRWALGLAAHDLGTGFLRQQPLALVGRPLVSKLVDAVGENAHLAVLNGRDVVYVVEERAPGKPSLVTDVGVRLPAHLTASGRSMLAQMSREQLLALYPDDTAFANRGDTVMTRRRLRDELRETRERGFATEHGDVTRGLSSVAVAIVDRVGWPIAALALTYADDSANSDALVVDVRKTAAEISRRLRV